MVEIGTRKGLEVNMKFMDILVRTRSMEEHCDMIVVIKYFQDEYRKLKLNKIKSFEATGKKLGRMSIKLAREYGRIKQGGAKAKTKQK